MSRDYAQKHFPTVRRGVALVDQYSFARKDTNIYNDCPTNGIDAAIFGCDGNINFMLPLDKFPAIGPGNVPMSPQVIGQQNELQQRIYRDVLKSRKWPYNQYRDMY